MLTVDMCLIATRGVTLTASVLPSATTVKMKVNGQLEIFAIVNGQATIFLLKLVVKLVKIKGNFGTKT